MPSLASFAARQCWAPKECRGDGCNETWLQRTLTFKNPKEESLMSNSKCRTTVTAALAAFAIAALIMTSPVSAGKKTKMDTPTISCAGSTQASINIQVCAPSGTGATGAPAGFSIQWLTAAQLAAGADNITST